MTRRRPRVTRREVREWLRVPDDVGAPDRPAFAKARDRARAFFRRLISRLKK